MHYTAIICLIPSQGDVSLEAGVTLDRELPDLVYDVNGNAVYSFIVTVVDRGSPVQMNSAMVSWLSCHVHMTACNCTDLWTVACVSDCAN